MDGAGRETPRSIAMKTEEKILAEAEQGEVVCRLYQPYGERDDEGFTKDATCKALCERGLLRFHGWQGQRTSPFGMVSKWGKA